MPLQLNCSPVIQDDHVEALDENPKKTKLFFAYAAETWEAEFYVKVNDDVYVKIGMCIHLILVWIGRCYKDIQTHTLVFS